MVMSIAEPNEIMEKAQRGEILNQMDLLILKSRSFSRPILDLDYCRGEEEGKKFIDIMTSYNILRELDTAEDGKLSKEDKFSSMDKICYVVAEIVRRGPQAAIDDLIDNDLADITKTLKRGAINEEEKVFVEHFGKGVVLRDFHNLVESKVQEAIKDCVGTMASGMKKYTDMGEIKDEQQLEGYTYFVAGIIGSLALNKIVEIKDKVELDKKSAETLGTYLQLVNILKNVHEDHSYGDNRIRFIPRIFRPKIRYDHLLLSNGVKSKEARCGAFNSLVDLVEGKFSQSLDHLLGIHEKLQGYQVFCLIPTLTAEQTINHMKEAGADKVFGGERDAIKVPREVFENIVNFSEKIVKIEKGRRVKEWLADYKNKPKNYSFIPDKYNDWSIKYLAT